MNGKQTMIEHVDVWLRELAEAGTRLDQLGALEGAAGNMSLFLPADTPGLDEHVTSILSDRCGIDLPGQVALPAGVLFITGTGRRLRELASRSGAILCAIVIAEDGSAMLHRTQGRGVWPTSELDSHVGIHAACLNGQPAIHAVVHAQPRKLTWLSHIPAYRVPGRLNRQLLRWQPEMIAMIPEGIGILPFETPGTPKQGYGTAWAMRQQRLVIWAKHGVVARSSDGPLAAVDLIDYAETAASYEVDDILAGRPADGLTLVELRSIAARFGVSASLLDRLPEDILRA